MRETLIGSPIWQSNSHGSELLKTTSVSMKGGLCVGHPNPELWFSSKPEDKRKAKEICSRCPVRDVCLAQSALEEYGIWGGEQRYPELQHPCVNGVHERTRENIKPIIIGREVTYGCLDCEDEELEEQMKEVA